MADTDLTMSKDPETVVLQVLCDLEKELGEPVGPAQREKMAIKARLLAVSDLRHDMGLKTANRAVVAMLRELGYESRTF